MPKNRAASIPYSLETGLPCGRLTLKIAQNPEELEKVFRLRYKIFNEELGEGLPENADSGLDVDEFDRHCEHLMLIDKQHVVGTYRLLNGRDRPAQGFYTEGEFEISTLPIDPNQTVELGRGCIDSAHRNKTSLMALFWGLHQYVLARNARYLIGCGSLPPMSANDAEATYAELSALAKVRQIPGVHPRHPNEFHGDASRGQAQLPPLISLYLEFGAQIYGRPAYDPIFRCYDMLLVFDMEHLTPWGTELLSRFDRRLLVADKSPRD